MGTNLTAAALAAGTAVDRLSAEQRMQLDSVCASFAMERMEISAAARELGARYLLKELSFEELDAGLTALRQQA